MADDASSPIDHGLAANDLSIEAIFRAAVSQNLPIAIWRLPDTETVQVCLSLRNADQVENFSLEKSEPGFLFCPFLTTPDKPELFIRADINYSTQNGELQISDNVSESSLLDFRKALRDIDCTQPAVWHKPASETVVPEASASDYIAAVEAGIDAIKQEQLEKVVLSRSSSDALAEDFNPLRALQNMLKAYPKAFVSLVSIPGVGTWLGASPEILVSIDREQIFRTVALAGTQPANGETNLANAIWRQKEIEEQGMVERYILSCFKKLRLREYTEVGPRTVVAGNLMHLRTDFKVDLNEVDFPTLGTDMLHLLHPTSAICGLPKEPALEFIKQHEGYDRSYYSGYLGPVNSPTGTHLYVNLRCMQLLTNKVVLYAGAGITADSSAEKEYQETQYKMQTMRRILSNLE